MSFVAPSACDYRKKTRCQVVENICVAFNRFSKRRCDSHRSSSIYRRNNGGGERISVGEFSARYAVRRDYGIDSMESIFYFPLSLTLQNSIENGEFSFDANFVSPEFLGEVAEEMDSLDKTFLFSTVDLWWKNTYLLRR